MFNDSGRDALEASLNTRASIANTIEQVDTGYIHNVLVRGVVVEVMNDPSVFSDEEIEEMKLMVSQPSLIDSAPRNSILARIVSDGEDHSSPAAIKNLGGNKKEKIGTVGVIAYPFFPPNVCMPVKPGEQVWLITDTPGRKNSIMYWMSRISEPDYVDDINYTHSDRRYLGGIANKTSKEKADISSGVRPASQANIDDPEFVELWDLNDDGLDDRIFGFPNGTSEIENYTLKEEYAYEEIVKISEAYQQFRPQDVPRFTKRPGDFVIQGSNNTLICLGEDRGWKKNDDPISSATSNATDNDKKLSELKNSYSGAIDIVAGRGRYNWRLLNESVDTSLSPDPSSTASRVIKNSPHAKLGRDSYIETNKNPQASNNATDNRKDHPIEGDPDFYTDAARIIVSHSSNVDENFSISENLPTRIGESFGSYEVINSVNPSSVSAKADEIRIIARKLSKDEPLPGAPEINGSIRLIKEGTKDDDLAAIMLLPDGTIQITGSRIILGRSTLDGGEGGGPGEGESQPYVKYQQLEDLLNEFMDNILDFCKTLLTHTTPGFGAPSPQIVQASTELIRALESERKPQIPTIQSSRIFGE